MLRVQTERFCAPPVFTDLRTLAAGLVGEQYRRLRSAIGKAARAQSCLSDLAQAATCCDALEELLPSPRKKGTLNRSAIEASLLQTAVILYERATSAAGKRGERGSISIIDHLADQQRSDHDALVNLRQRALAHVYVGEILTAKFGTGMSCLPSESKMYGSQLQLHIGFSLIAPHLHGLNDRFLQRRPF